MARRSRIIAFYSCFYLTRVTRCTMYTIFSPYTYITHFGIYMDLVTAFTTFNFNIIVVILSFEIHRFY